MTSDHFDLTAFAAANPDRPILLILPAEERVQSVFVGDEPVFTEGEGVPVGHFEAGPLARVLKGWKARAGLDLMVNACASGPARLCVSVVADKRRFR